jgi:hypothetical protein
MTSERNLGLSYVGITVAMEEMEMMMNRATEMTTVLISTSLQMKMLQTGLIMSLPMILTLPK